MTERGGIGGPKASCRATGWDMVEVEKSGKMPPESNNMALQKHQSK